MKDPKAAQNQVQYAARQLQEALDNWHEHDDVGEELAKLKVHLKQAVAEKNRWMTKCKMMEASLSSLQDQHDIDGEHSSIFEQSPILGPGVPVSLRPRTNSELKFMADNIAIPARISGIFDKPNLPVHSRSSSNIIEDDPGTMGGRVPFRLLQCSDEACEVFQPRNGSIRTSHHARSHVQLIWDERPKRVLIIKKPNEEDVSAVCTELTTYLTHEQQMQVYVEPAVLEELPLLDAKSWEDKEGWKEIKKEIDFVICLGGDGTLLWLSQLFVRSIPPVLSFAMGSLGFLTPCDYMLRHTTIERIISGGVSLSLRSRISCYLVRNSYTEDSADKNEFYFSQSNSVTSFHALNEVVIDRGPSAAVVELDCYCDDMFVTKVTADGIILATPTGSTAYSLSAGGSMVHPSVPAMLLTPICPHSLSFRPLLFHDSATLKVAVPPTSRSKAYVSLDGTNRMELCPGDAVFVKVSSHPVPIICNTTENEDWFQSVKGNLNWNQRRAQKPLGSPVISKM